MIKHETLKRRQAWPIEKKIRESQIRIRDWYESWDGNVYVSFSGGLDSTVMLDVVRDVYPDVPAVLSNTGLEYPEVVSFAKKADNLTIVRPKTPFHKVIKKYGYPVISKRIAQYIYEVRHSRGETATKHLRLTGFRTDGTYSPMGKISEKWKYLCDAPFDISDKCCEHLKKKPMDAYYKKTGRVPYVGTMAEDSEQRTQTYFTFGCNAYDIKRPRSNPLSFWTNADIWKYVRGKGLEYSKIYDMGRKSTGCMFCMFGVHLDYARTQSNRFIKMRESHRKLWDYCINELDIGKVMDYIHVPYEDRQLKLW